MLVSYTNTALVASLLDALEDNELVLVTFRTKTGTNRVMGCTRLLAYIPEDKREGRFEPQLNKDSIVCVYDFQNSAWRSFRKDSVISFTTV